MFGFPVGNMREIIDGYLRDTKKTGLFRPTGAGGVKRAGLAGRSQHGANVAATRGRVFSGAARCWEKATSKNQESPMQEVFAQTI